eukprot:scaffold975_cov398-Prasinococcus_capsulatus_cf.AAC.11
MLPAWHPLTYCYRKTDLALNGPHRLSYYSHLTREEGDLLVTYPKRTFPLYVRLPVAQPASFPRTCYPLLRSRRLGKKSESQSHHTDEARIPTEGASEAWAVPSSPSSEAATILKGSLGWRHDAMFDGGHRRIPRGARACGHAGSVSGTPPPSTLAIYKLLACY